MSVADPNVCLSCGDQVILNVHYVTEHLERRHNILASAPVLAANMFANSQAYQEVKIILIEFDEKNAAIEHMEKSKMATLQMLSQKDLRIEALTKELIAMEKLSVSALADTARWNWEKISVDQELKNLKRQVLLTAVKMSKLADEKMNSDQKIEEQKREIRDLKLKNVSLVKEVKNKVKDVQEMEAENAKLKVCVEAQQTQLKSVTKSVEAVKCKVLLERKSLKNKIENLTAGLAETKGELQKQNNMLEAKHNVIKDLQKQLYVLETVNDVMFVETSNQTTQGQLEDLQTQILKLEIALEKKDDDFQRKWEILITEKEILTTEKEISMTEKDDNMENMRRSFDEDRLCFEVKMDVKEKEIEDLRSKLRNASKQADLTKSDLKKHHKNLTEHFQAITKAMHVIRNLDGSRSADVINLSKKVLDTFVKTLVAEDQNSDGMAGGLLLREISSGKTESDLQASGNEENNNDHQAHV